MRVTVPAMIDMHCHVLPGLDDGPRDMDEAVDMARMAVADGICGIICTPHWHPTIWPNEGNGIAQAVRCLSDRLCAEGVELKLWPGSELSFDPTLVDGLNNGRIASLAGSRWVLLELPPGSAPPAIDEFLLALRQNGHEVVLAHPERYIYVERDPLRLHAWVEMGVTVQITAASLLGRLGPKLAALCHLMLEHRLVHFLASDGHGIRSRRPTLGQATLLAGQIAGPGVADLLTESNPWAVIRNEPINLLDYQPIRPTARKRPWYKRLFFNS